VKILIVEDEPEPREGLCALLRGTSPDWELLPPCATGEEGLRSVEALRPDLVITDIRMPDLNGLEMVSSFKNSGSHPAVIVLSGYPDFEYARRCLALGVKDYLLKPSTAKVLVETVNAVEEMHSVDGDLLDGLEGKAPLPCPGVLFLFRAASAFTPAQRKILRREVSGLTGNPAGTLVADFPNSGELFFLAKQVTDLQRSLLNRFLENLKQKLHVPVVGAAAAITEIQIVSSQGLLRKALKQFVLRPVPGFLWPVEKLVPFLPVNYPLALEKELFGTIASVSHSETRTLLKRFHSELFREGFDPEVVLKFGQRLFVSLQKRLEDVDPGRFALIQSLDPVRLLETALDCQDAEGVFDKVADIMETPSSPPERTAENVKIQSALTMIEKRLNSPPTLAECACELGMSSEYLSRLFKAQMATGYAKYVMRRRVDAAKAMIASSRATIKQISESLGFQNSKYFCAIFRNETGLTPSEYRAQFF